MTIADRGARDTLRFSFPCTFVDDGDTLWIVAGEDIRYSISAPRVAAWAQSFLRRIDGTKSRAELVAEVDGPHRRDAIELLDRLESERLISETFLPPSDVLPIPYLEIVGSNPLVERLKAVHGANGASNEPVMRVLCQADLDYHDGRLFSRGCVEQGVSYAWISYGAQARAYVSPIFLPDCGPCLECLLDTFENLSPSPEIHQALNSHSSKGNEFASASFPTHGVELLVRLFLWKFTLFVNGELSPAIHRLHVLETAALEINSYPVQRNPWCAHH